MPCDMRDARHPERNRKCMVRTRWLDGAHRRSGLIPIHTNSYSLQYLSALSLAVPGDGGFQAFRRQGLLSDLGGFVIGSTMRKAVSRVIVASSTSIYDVLHFLR